MKPQAVIFDLFGTIVEDFSVASAGSNHAAVPAALGLPYDPFMQHWRQITDRRSLGEFQPSKRVSSMSAISSTRAGRLSKWQGRRNPHATDPSGSHAQTGRCRDSGHN